MNKTAIKNFLKKIPCGAKVVYLRQLYRKSCRNQEQSLYTFLKKHWGKIRLVGRERVKGRQLATLLREIAIDPVPHKTFFYALDCFTKPLATKSILNNNSCDYAVVVHDSFKNISKYFADIPTSFGESERATLEALSLYVRRLYAVESIAENYAQQLAAITSLFTRPAETFFEGLQRILFFNQLLWQTGHSLVGLGRLDHILGDLYRHDIEHAVLTKKEAKELCKAFLLTLHEYYWFKSNVLLGDTGQIIILGGKEQNGRYFCNELTYLFVEVIKELRLPDPKILLRCSADMPDDLLELALECMATGIGAPLLSNDETVIPALISCGYDEKDACAYCTAACWEPLIPGISCELNNSQSLNFAVPFTQLVASAEFLQVTSKEALLVVYEEYLKRYISSLLTPLTRLEFEEDPLLSLVSRSALEKTTDITRGGAKYSSLGLTSVGLGTVVNSILNIEKLVFVQKKYTLAALQRKCAANWAGCEDIVTELQELRPAYGSDCPEVIALTKRIMSVTSAECKNYRTRYGGYFKVGLSSPNYITDAKNLPATFDGRKKGEPFSVHISSAKAIPTTALLSFAMALDYHENRCNGNVVDFFTTPGMLTKNIGTYAALLRASFVGGGGNIPATGECR